MKEFKLGKINVMPDVEKKMKSDDRFKRFVQMSLGKYSNCSWGNMSRDGKNKNNEAIEKGEEVVGYYTFGKEKLRIVTTADRSSTTIMFPEQNDISNSKEG